MELCKFEEGMIRRVIFEDRMSSDMKDMSIGRVRYEETMIARANEYC